MNRLSSVLIVLLFALSCGSACCQSNLSTGVAISLKAFQQELAEYGPGDNCPDELRLFGGMTQVEGLVLDEENNDLIVYGTAQPGQPPLHTEDFVVAARNVWRKYAEVEGNTIYYAYPGCDISAREEWWRGYRDACSSAIQGETEAEVERSAAPCRAACERDQHVTVFGIPHNTRFAGTMVEADYLCKRITDGSVDPDVEGIVSLSELAQNHPELWGAGQMLNRFEFVPGECSYVDEGTIAKIADCPVELITEEEYATRTGSTGSGRPHPLAAIVARKLTNHYRELAEALPVYRELANVFRFVAIANLMSYKGIDRSVNLDYILDDFPLTMEPVDSLKPGIWRLITSVDTSSYANGTWISSSYIRACGGVSIRMKVRPEDIFPDEDRRLPAEKELVLQATQPNRSVVHFDLPPEVNLRTRVSRPPRTVPANIVRRRQQQSRDAMKKLNSSDKPLLVDLYINESDQTCHLEVIDWQDNVREAEPAQAQKFRELFEDANIAGRAELGERHQREWQELIDNLLGDLIADPDRSYPDGIGSRPKQLLVLRTNHIDYGFAGLEKVHALNSNFNLAVTGKSLRPGETRETPVDELADRLGNAPALRADNVLFVVNLSEVESSRLPAWEEALTKLRSVVGHERVLVDPSKQTLLKAIENSEEEVGVAVVGHFPNGILCRDGEIISSRDIESMAAFKGLRFLFPLGCKFQSLERGALEQAFRAKGIELTLSSYRMVNEVDVLQGLTQLTDVLSSTKALDSPGIPVYHLPGILWSPEFMKLIRGIIIGDSNAGAGQAEIICACPTMKIADIPELGLAA